MLLTLRKEECKKKKIGIPSWPKELVFAVASVDGIEFEAEIIHLQRRERTREQYHRRDHHDKPATKTTRCLLLHLRRGLLLAAGANVLRGKGIIKLVLVIVAQALLLVPHDRLIVPAATSILFLLMIMLSMSTTHAFSFTAFDTSRCRSQLRLTRYCCKCVRACARQIRVFAFAGKPAFRFSTARLD